MDSLTQIVLGASVAEVSVGKKIGNRSILWGGIAGTIPDLDVISNLWMDPLDALSFHRGISHSFLFAILAPPLLGLLIHFIYNSKYHKYIAFACWSLLFTGLAIPILLSGANLIMKLASIVLVGAAVASFYRRYFKKERKLPKASLKDWILLFFVAIVTHPILDTFTTYGTQLFQPFSNYRVSFCNISVADPLYTIPLITALVLMAKHAKEKNIRRKLVWIGLALSSLYMVFTLWNKTHINSVFEKSLVESKIDYKRYMTSPTILNNVLWFCIAEREDDFVYGLYSVFDTKNRVALETIPKNYDVLAAKKSDHTVNTLNWFSDGYYTIIEREGSIMQLNDMRFGIFDDGNGNEDYIFRFDLQKDSSGDYILVREQAGPPNDKRLDIFKQLWERIKGI
jgi:inner membrane protein